MKTYTLRPAPIRLAAALFTAMAHESLVRPIVEDYETAILAKHQFKIAQKWVEQGGPNRVILNRKDAFLLSSEDAGVYSENRHPATSANGRIFSGSERLQSADCVEKSTHQYRKNRIIGITIRPTN